MLNTVLDIQSYMRMIRWKSCGRGVIAGFSRHFLHFLFWAFDRHIQYLRDHSFITIAEHNSPP